jgi:hypothetical protein
MDVVTRNLQIEVFLRRGGKGGFTHHLTLPVSVSLICEEWRLMPQHRTVSDSCLSLLKTFPSGNPLAHLTSNPNQHTGLTISTSVYKEKDIEAGP